MKLDKISATRHHNENFLDSYSHNGKNQTSVARPLETGVDQWLVCLLPAFRLLHLEPGAVNAGRYAKYRAR